MESATVTAIYLMVLVFFGLNFYFTLSFDKMNDDARNRLEERMEQKIKYLKDGTKQDIKFQEEETKREAKYLEGRMERRIKYLENRVERIEQRSLNR